MTSWLVLRRLFLPLREEVSHMPPLTPEQQAFAEEHHGLILDFMEKHSLDDDYYGS